MVYGHITLDSGIKVSFMQTNKSLSVNDIADGIFSVVGVVICEFLEDEDSLDDSDNKETDVYYLDAFVVSSSELDDET